MGGAFCALWAAGRSGPVCSPVREPGEGAARSRQLSRHNEPSTPPHTNTQTPTTNKQGALAEKCHAFAKALHYKEMEFTAAPAAAIEALIHINNQLRQPEAAVGVLTYAQRHLAMELKEGWYEKLCRWDEALEAYQRRLAREVRCGDIGGYSEGGGGARRGIWGGVFGGRREGLEVVFVFNFNYF